jgi:hypothetical protein
MAVTAGPVTTITYDPVTPVTDRPWPMEETAPRQQRTAQGGETAREVEQVADKEITPKEPEKAKEQKSEDKAATRVSRLRRTRRLRRTKR